MAAIMAAILFAVVGVCRRDTVAVTMCAGAGALRLEALLVRKPWPGLRLSLNAQLLCRPSWQSSPSQCADRWHGC
jgi:hypothetical protein